MKFLFAEGVISSKARRCERDNGYNTHLARRLGLFQAHYMNDDWLVKGIRKRKQEATWQSTLSSLPQALIDVFLSGYQTENRFVRFVTPLLFLESFSSIAPLKG